MTRWLRIGEAARILNLSVDTLRQWDRQGQFRARRTWGNHRRYALAEVRALARARRRTNPSRHVPKAQRPPLSEEQRRRRYASPDLEKVIRRTEEWR